MPITDRNRRQGCRFWVAPLFNKKLHIAKGLKKFYNEIIEKRFYVKLRLKAVTVEW